jgi:predicted house-cleaning noncanonical NTP pyrophosphatase (MazG superfamily)
MKKEYNKLIRDRIPEIIEKDGKTCKTRVLSEKDYKSALNSKLLEEMKEYQEGFDLRELADLQEVINAIVLANGLSLKEFDEIREAKAKANGGFSKRLFLESVDDGKK